MKSGKFINLKINEQFKCGYGTVDSKNLKSVYSKISCWIEPTETPSNWNGVIGGLKRKISSSLTESLKMTDKFKKDRFIVDLDIRASGLEEGKKSFMNCEITLFTTDNYEIRTPEFKTDVKGIIGNIIDNTIIEYDKFQYFKSKRG
jgi:hypothetical protein